MRSSVSVEDKLPSKTRGLTGAKEATALLPNGLPALIRDESASAWKTWWHRQLRDIGPAAAGRRNLVRNNSSNWIDHGLGLEREFLDDR